MISKNEGAAKGEKPGWESFKRKFLIKYFPTISEFIKKPELLKLRVGQSVYTVCLCMILLLALSTCPCRVEAEIEGDSGI